MWRVEWRGNTSTHLCALLKCYTAFVRLSSRMDVSLSDCSANFIAITE